MAQHAGTALLALSLLACGTSVDPSEGPTAWTSAAPTFHITGMGAPPLPYPAIEDNIANDTLLIQTTFDLDDGTFVMVASPVDIDELRLYHYRLKAAGSAEILAASWSAYDSWTMLPTFFGDDPAATNALWILANYGERESWGQLLVRMNNGFQDHGFLDVALPERMLEDDTLRLKRRNIAPHMRYSSHGDTVHFQFACDSVFLYDDQAGGLDRLLSAHRIQYSWHPVEGLVLWLDGKPRAVKRPA